MATNLLIGYPQIATDSTLTPSSAFNSAYPETNLVYGARTDLAQLDTADTESSIVYDAGTASARQIDFVYIAKANILKAQGSKRAGLSGSTDDVTYTEIALNTAGLQTCTLYGPDAQDLIFTAELPGYTDGSLPDAISYRYYKAEFAGSGTCPSKRYSCSKIMFGQWFDFGRDPEWSAFSSRPLESGARNPYTFSFTWQGITPSIKNSAEDLLFSYKERGVILYTRDYHAPLLDYRAIHAFVTSYDLFPITDGSWNITINFEEQI